MTREPVQIVEIVQPFCSRTYGNAPCTASGATGAECFNTRATCQDTPNFELSAGGLSLFFARGETGDIDGVPYLFPALVSVSTVPTEINMAGSNPDSSGLGKRAKARIVLAPMDHSDRRVDPYVTGRFYNPRTQGTFWTKWLKRNQYRNNMQINIYEGYIGERLTDMNKRVYFAESFDGPDARGNVSIVAKDVLSATEARKAQAPRPSPGILVSAMDAVATSFEVTNAVEADYSATGTLRINDEVMTYTGRATSENGVTFTGVVRATDGTQADEHGKEDTVQECLRFDDVNVDEVVSDLLTTYSGVDAAFIDSVAWQAEREDYRSFYRVSNLITEPRDVSKLLSELQEQCLFNIWWDERAQKIEFSAIKARVADAPLLTEESHILEGSFQIKELPRERVSQVWLSYLFKNPVEVSEKASNYRVTFVSANLESETPELYGEQSVRKIYSNWLKADALAKSTAQRITTLYTDPPREAVVKVDAKDRASWTGDVVQVSHTLDTDILGQNADSYWTIIKAEEVQAGEVVQYTLRDTTRYGRFDLIMDNATPDFTPGDTVSPGESFIGDSSGLLSDGTTAGAVIR